MLTILLALTGGVASVNAQDDEPRNVLFIGNSFTGGKSVGRVCDVMSRWRGCADYAIPGQMMYEDYEFFRGSTGLCCNYAPRNPMDDSLPYDAVTNPNYGDVPGKVKRLADAISGSSLDSSTFRYAQNTQSRFRTKTHANHDWTNRQRGTVSPTKYFVRICVKC